MEKLSHTDAQGKARMVDVSHKDHQLRKARASGIIKMSPETLILVRENNLKKGDVLVVAEIAGIQAAKKTSELIPLCHPLALTNIDVKAELTDQGVKVTSEVMCTGPTGVEMEALTAVQVALLAVYDMCKAVDKKMSIENVRLEEKTKSDL